MEKDLHLLENPLITALVMTFIVFGVRYVILIGSKKYNFHGLAHFFGG